MGIQIGLSGGHTRSQAMAIQHNAVIGSAIGPGLSDHINVDPTTATGVDGLTTKTDQLLYELIASINANSPETGIRNLADLCDNIDAVTIAMPGVTTAYDHERLTVAFAPFKFNKVEIVDDTWAALVAGLQCCRGISVIAGTGASVYIGIDKFRLDKAYKLDGFGALIGDWGSGFRLAVRFLEEAARAHDFGEPFPLEQPMLEEARRIHSIKKLESIDGIQNWLDILVRNYPTNWRTKLAVLAKVVTKAADEDPASDLAIRLVRESSKQLADTICAALKRLRELDNLPIDLVPEDMRVVCKGGQIENSKLYQSSLITSVRALQIDNEIIFSEFSPVVGASLLSVFAPENLRPENEAVVRLAESIRKWPNALEAGLLVPALN